MWIDIFLNLVLLAYVAVAVLLIVAWRWEKRRELLKKWAAWTGIAAAFITIVTNLLVLFSPELFIADPSFALLVIIALFAPTVVLVGGILVCFKRRFGVIVLAIGTGLWLLNTIIGLIGSMTNVLG